jgi:hypothetical protein
MGNCTCRWLTHCEVVFVIPALFCLSIAMIVTNFAAVGLWEGDDSVRVDGNDPSVESPCAVLSHYVLFVATAHTSLLILTIVATGTLTSASNAHDAAATNGLPSSMTGSGTVTAASLSASSASLAPSSSSTGGLVRSWHVLRCCSVLSGLFCTGLLAFSCVAAAWLADPTVGGACRTTAGDTGGGDGTLFAVALADVVIHMMATACALPGAVRWTAVRCQRCAHSSSSTGAGDEDDRLIIGVGIGSPVNSSAPNTVTGASVITPLSLPPPTLSSRSSPATSTYGT